jgi:hypothetical protein
MLPFQGLGNQEVGNRWVKALRRRVALALADIEFVQCWLFRLPIGKRPFGERLPQSPTKDKTFVEKWYLFSDLLDNGEDKPYFQPDFSNQTTLVATFSTP